MVFFRLVVCRHSDPAAPFCLENPARQFEQQANRAFGAYNGSDYAHAAYGVADWKTNATSTASM